MLIKNNNFSIGGLKGLQGRQYLQEKDTGDIFTGKDEFSHSSVGEKPDFMKLRDNLASMKKAGSVKSVDDGMKAKGKKGGFFGKLLSGIAMGGVPFSLFGGGGEAKEPEIDPSLLKTFQNVDVKIIAKTGANAVKANGNIITGPKVAKPFLAMIEQNSGPDKQPLFDATRGALSGKVSERTPYCVTTSALSSLAEDKPVIDMLLDTAINSMEGGVESNDLPKIGKAFLDEVEKESDEAKQPLFDATRQVFSSGILKNGPTYLTKYLFKSLKEGDKPVKDMLIDIPMAVDKDVYCGYEEKQAVHNAFFNESAKHADESKSPLFNASKAAISSGLKKGIGPYRLQNTVFNALKEDKPLLPLLLDTADKATKSAVSPRDCAKVGKAFLDEIEKYVDDDKKPLIFTVNMTLDQNLDDRSAAHLLMSTIKDLNAENVSK